VSKKDNAILLIIRSPESWASDVAKWRHKTFNRIIKLENTKTMSLLMTRIPRGRGKRPLHAREETTTKAVILSAKGSTREPRGLSRFQRRATQPSRKSVKLLQTVRASARGNWSRHILIPMKGAISMREALKALGMCLSGDSWSVE
jgi:hypothetical protein